MSTRASIIIKDESTTLFFYRHSDGYPDVTGADLKAFVQDYKTKAMRTDVMQSAGWLIVRGHKEYLGKPFTGKPDASDRGYGWKVGAYEPSDGLVGDAEYVYVIDLKKMTLECRIPNASFWDSPDLKNTRQWVDFETVSFAELAAV